MSAPEDRLISDITAERLQHEAVEILTSKPFGDPRMRELAVATLALTRDRDGRQELAILGRLSVGTRGCYEVVSGILTSLVDMRWRRR